MYLIFFAVSVLANLCLNAISQEGKSIIQLLIGDYENLSEKSISVQQFLYSGKDMNDLGHYSSCSKLANSSYLILDFKGHSIPVYLGVCLPKECTVSSLSDLIFNEKLPILPKALQTSALTPDDLKIYNPKTYPFGTGSFIASAIITGLVILVAAGTFFDEKSMKRQQPAEEEKTFELSSLEHKKTQFEMQRPAKKPSKAMLMLQSFSITKNWSSLFYRPFSDSTAIFDGIRAFSIGWVILGNVYLTRIRAVVYNIDDVIPALKSKLAAFGYSSIISMDALLWLSGFLFGYLILNEALKRKGHVNWPTKVTGRIMRLLPVYILVMLFANLIEPSLGSGPLWHQMEELVTLDCAKYWWSNFLFINNLVPDFTGNSCLPQTWFLAVEIQLFFLSIPLIFFYFKFPKHYTWLLISCIISATLLYKIAITIGNEIYISPLNSLQTEEKYRLIYVNTFSRAPPYLFGVLCGFVYCQKKTGHFIDYFAKVAHNFFSSGKVKAYGAFFLGCFLINIAFWVPYNCYQDDGGDFLYYSKTGNAVFLSFYNILTGLGFTLMFMPVLYELIPSVHLLLSAEMWGPIGKASASIYMTHLCVMRGFLASEEYGFTFTQLNLFTDFVFNATLEIPIGILVYITVEAPFARLMKILLAGKRKEKPKQQALLDTELKENF